MDTKHQLLCTWSAPIFVVLLSVGWVLVAGYIPPHSPDASAIEIAEFYRRHAAPIKAGMILSMLAAGFVGPWVAVIATQMKRIEGGFPVLAYTQMICGAIGILAFLLPVMIWATLAFRPDRDPQLTLLFNDLAWLLLTVTISPAVVQNIAIGTAILGDKNPRPVFPRWAAYLNFWVATSFVPALLIPFFKTGPFAWDGLIGFWMPLVDFGAWIVAMFFLLRRAIAQQASAG